MEATVEVGGGRYYVEALDLDRLHANLAATFEEALELRRHAARNREEPQWTEKAVAAEKLYGQLRQLIDAKREQVA